MTVHVLSSSSGPTAPISFRNLAKAIPARREGRPVSVSTLHRWRIHGLRGVTLEAIRIGGSWYSSLDAFERFCLAVTTARTNTGIAATPPDRTSKDAVDVALQGLGFQ